MTATDSLIVKVIEHYEVGWEPPEDYGKEWISCLCPFHGDSRPSASVSYQNDAFKCFVCDESGSAISIIMRKESVSYREALEYAEKLSPGSREKLQGSNAGKSGRRVFGESGPSGDGGAISPGVRGRSTPWT